MEPTLERRPLWKETLDVLLGKPLLVIALLLLSFLWNIIDFPAQDHFSPFQFVAAWGALALLYDLFTRRALLQTAGSLWLLAFCMGDALTLALSGASLYDGVVCFFINVLLLFMCYAAFGRRREGRLFFFNCAAIALVLFVDIKSLSDLLTSDPAMPQGMMGGYFYGVTMNPNYLGALNACALAAALLNMERALRPKPKALVWLFVLLACVFFFFLSASVSRTSLIFCVVSGLPLAVYAALRLSARWKSGFARFALAVVCAVGVTYGLFSGFSSSQDLFLRLLPEGTPYYRKLNYADYFAKLRASSAPEEEAAAFAQVPPSRRMRLSIRPAPAATSPLPLPVLPRNGMEVQPLALDDAAKNVLTSSRFSVWQTGLAIWRESPAIGVGQANVALRYESYKPQAPQPHLHNGYLQILAANGMVGFFIFAAFGLYVFICSRKQLARGFAGDASARQSVFLFSFILGFLVYNVAESAILYTLIPVCSCFWLFLGAYAASIPSQERGRLDVDRYFRALWNKLFPKYNLAEPTP